MRAHFPDTKSAALACEQIASAGYPLSHFTLTETRPKPVRQTRPSSHVSMWDRIIHLFGSGSLPAQQRGNKTGAATPQPEEEVGETILFSTEAVDGVIRSIILQHGGYLEPSSTPSAGQQLNP